MELDQRLRAALDSVPMLADPLREVEELPGGLTNTNLKVTVPAGTFVARISGVGSDDLGIDRDAEHHDSLAAAEVGVGAPVVDYRPGILVIAWIEGPTLDNAGVAADLDRIAQACRRLHTAQPFRRRFDMFALQPDYLSTVRERGFALPAGYDDQADTFARIEQALAVHPNRLVSCHNDLLAANFVDDGPQIRIIDYEYAGTNDPAFELGNLAVECELGADGLDALTSAYFGEERRDQVARARLLGAVGAYGWTLWGVIQQQVSDLDYDFDAWGQERYERALEVFTGDDLGRLLDQVTT